MNAKTRALIVLGLCLLFAQTGCNLKYYVGYQVTPTLPAIVLTAPPPTLTPIPTAIPTLTPIPTVAMP
ncbi:MAG: hypothetical protein ACPG8W_26290 [Candidatus Promineifilaceae bacterium]